MREKVGRISRIVEAIQRLEQILAREPRMALGPLDACNLLIKFAPRLDSP